MKPQTETRTALLGRLVQLHVLSADVAAATGRQDVAKRARVTDLCESFTALATDAAVFSPPVVLTPASPDELTSHLQAVLNAHRTSISDKQAAAIILDVCTSTDWPDKTSWSRPKAELLTDSINHLGSVRREEVEIIIDRHHNATKRLRKDALSPKAQIAMGGVSAVAALASGGFAAGLGTVVGTQLLGLTGAAATSAGLAFLGGGSLAAGGLGMAGGMFLGHAASHGLTMAGRRILAEVAGVSRDAFIDEVARLDVAVSLAPESQAASVVNLRQLRALLVARQSGELRGGFAGGKGTSLSQDRATLSREQVAVHRDNVDTALRVIDYEIRHLLAPSWKRLAHVGPRFMGVPAASKLLDNL